MLKSVALSGDSLTPEWFKYDDVRAKYGVTVEQWIDFQTFVGDSGDGIPGADGIGPQKAADLLQARGDLDKLAVDPNVPGIGIGKKTIEKLVAFLANDRELMRQLVTLKTDIDLSDSIDFNNLPVRTT